MRRRQAHTMENASSCSLRLRWDEATDDEAGDAAPEVPLPFL
jgi:hypothetical protein